MTSLAYISWFLFIRQKQEIVCFMNDFKEQLKNYIVLEKQDETSEIEDTIFFFF